MATIVYLDAEDEITSAATRIRQAGDNRVALVIPFGSRVATSRINFKLLSREAMSAGRRLDIVAPDASARALAASAGLPVFSSVAEYEDALEAPQEATSRPDDGTAAVGAGLATAGHAGPAPGAGAGPIADAGDDDDTTQVEVARPVGVTGVKARSAPDARSPAAREAELDAIVRRSREIPIAKPPRRSPRRGLIAGLLVLLLALGAAAVAAVVLLPSADITITPHVEAVGPIDLVVTADPAATAVNEAAGVIPAQTVELPVEVSGEFPATGRRVAETPARGGVRMRNCDPSAPYTIPSGTVVRTQGGVEFAIDESVFLPVAVISGTGANVNLRCSVSDVSVTAVEPGPGGNVPADAISVIPARYNRTLISVNNPSATDGGTREEFTRVSRRDVESALAALDEQLQGAFELQLEDPSAAPPGATLFPETAVLGEAAPTVDPEELVNQEVETFRLGLAALGTALAVDSTPVETIAQTALQDAVTPGWELVPDSTRVAVGDGTVRDGVVEFPVAGVAKQVQPIDGAALRTQVMGLSAAEARALLEPFGDVSLGLWPEMVTTVPTLGQRVTLVVLDPVDDLPDESPVPATPEPTEPASEPADGESPGEPVPSG